MPLQYAAGIVKEHNHVRGAAGLFDVSHMGQARLGGPDFETAAAAIEALAPADILSLKPGRIRYTQLLNAQGGVIDDLMVTRSRDGAGLSLIVNASRQEIDFAHIRRWPAGGHRACAAAGARAARPARAESCRGSFARDTRRGTLMFHGKRNVPVKSEPVYISRSGYTGEDGFEISVPAASAENLARQLLAEPEVLPIGLGARDTLRLEAGLPLYGQDMDEATSPVEAGLAFSIGKRRRAEGGFPGAERILP